jgi:uncharacterized repeat protein (TIGR03803 family)
MRSRHFGCGLALTLLVPAAGAAAQKTETVLYSFTGGADGSNPFSGLIEDKAGNFYGTTVEGGIDGLGAIYKLAPDGTETVLASFTGANGSYPESGVIVDKHGNFYGTTSSGGAGGFGTVFEVTAGGTTTVLHSFTGSPDGKGPGAGLVLDKKGNLYGTTVFGGAKNDGAVFEVTAAGTEKVRYSFKVTDGAFPAGGLIVDTSGNLYGTTQQGGSTACGGGGCGEVFKLVPNGKSWTETVLHAFTGNDGVFPEDSLAIDASGNLYGTTEADGAGGNGTVFKVTSAGVATVLYSFTGPDGAQPYAGVIVDKNGNLFGTTMLGGTNDYGTVYEVTAGGKEKVLYSFNSQTNGTDGFEPYAGVIEDKAGNLYGTTYGGGANASGAVFVVSKQ